MDWFDDSMVQMGVKVRRRFVVMLFDSDGREKKVSFGLENFGVMAWNTLGVKVWHSQEVTVATSSSEDMGQKICLRLWKDMWKPNLALFSQYNAFMT